MKKPVAKEEYKTKVVYAGKRIAQFGKTAYQVFLVDGDPAKQRVFTGIQGVAVGATYLAGKTTMLKRPEEVVGAKAIPLTQTQITAFSVAHWAAVEKAREILEDKRNRTKAAKRMTSPRLKAIANEIQAVTKGMGWFEKEYLIRALFRKMER